MPKINPSMPPDQLLRYKAQLELATSRQWSWTALAEGLGIDASTLRNIRFTPDSVNVGTLRKVETFLRSHGVDFTVSAYLHDSHPLSDLVLA